MYHKCKSYEQRASVGLDWVMRAAINKEVLMQPLSNLCYTRTRQSNLAEAKMM